MSKNHSNLSNIFQQINLIGNPHHKEFLTILSDYGIQQSGGSFPISYPLQLKRLVFDVNLLDSSEQKQIVYSELITKN